MASQFALTWPEGRPPGNGYPLCPGCGHDFGQHSPGLGCPTCFNARTPCTVDQGAVFDAIEAAVVAASQETTPTGAVSDAR